MFVSSLSVRPQNRSVAWLSDRACLEGPTGSATAGGRDLREVTFEI